MGAQPSPDARAPRTRARRSSAVGGRVITSAALVAAVMAATQPSGTGAEDQPVVPAVAASATLALRVPVDAMPDDAAARDWETSLGDSGPGGAPEGGLTLSGSVLAPATLRAGTLPSRVEAAYVAAADRMATDQPACGLPWWLLAGVGQVESGHAAGGRVRDDGVTLSPVRGPRLDGTLAGTAVVRDSDAGAMDGDPAYDRAVGPMQFMPGTWASWGADGDGDGRRDADDVDDAALAAARYLCHGAADGALAGQGGQASALFRYNRSVSYGLEVIRWGIGFRDGRAAPLVPAPLPDPVDPVDRVDREDPPSPVEEPPVLAGPEGGPGPVADQGPAAGADPAPDQPATGPATPSGPAAEPEPGPAPGIEDPAAAPQPSSPSPDPASPASPTPPPCSPPEQPAPTGDPTTGDPTSGDPAGPDQASPGETSTAPPTGPSTAPPVPPTGEPTSVVDEPAEACPPPCGPAEDGASPLAPDGPVSPTDPSGTDPSATEPVGDPSAVPGCLPAPEVPTAPARGPVPTASGTSAPLPAGG